MSMVGVEIYLHGLVNTEYPDTDESETEDFVMVEPDLDESKTEKLDTEQTQANIDESIHLEGSKTEDTKAMKKLRARVENMQSKRRPHVTVFFCELFRIYIVQRIMKDMKTDACKDSGIKVCPYHPEVAE